MIVGSLTNCLTGEGYRVASACWTVTVVDDIYGNWTESCHPFSSAGRRKLQLIDSTHVHYAVFDS